MTGERIRVAVTGAGAKTPAGNDVASMLAAVQAAKSTAETIPILTDAGAPVRFACAVPDFDTTPYCTRREQRQLDRAALLALAAGLDAAADAQLVMPADPVRVGVAVGVGMGGVATAADYTLQFGTALPGIPANAVPRIMANAAAARISMRLGARGPALTYVSACASGATAIGEAASKIRTNELDVAVAGGVDAAIHPLVITAFAHSGALSRRNDEPSAASRPFDADRDGFVMGEGAAMLVLERWDHAVARGARILGELMGFGANADAHHIVAPLEDGELAARCMRQAVADAGLSFTDIGHINAHGTSTLLNDRAEARAVHACFGDHCPPVTAPKGVMGHLIGGAGAVEAVITLATAASGIVPPVANFVGGELADLIDIVAEEPRTIGPAFGLSNSFGFGGHNATLVFGPA